MGNLKDEIIMVKLRPFHLEFILNKYLNRIYMFLLILISITNV